MDSKTKKIVFFIGSLFVAVLFLSSYAAFSNNNVSQGSVTSTTKSPQTFLLTGSANALVAGYGDVASVNATSNITNHSASIIANEISSLQANGEIVSYSNAGSNYRVELANITPYYLQQRLYNLTGLYNSIDVGASTTLTLPSKLGLYYGNSLTPVTLQNLNYSLYMDNVKALNSTVNVNILALVEPNGTVYQMKLSYNK